MSGTHTPPDMDDALDLLAEQLQPEPGTMRVQDLTAEFPWVTYHRLVFGFATDGGTAAVALSEQYPPLLLSGEDSLAALSTLIVRERGDIPDGIPLMELAEAVRRCAGSDPLGLVGEPKLLKLPTWAKEHFANGDPAQQVQLRTSFGTAPVLYDLGQGKFRLDFYFWNAKGGVEMWVVEGDRQALRSAQTWEVAPPGSFNWPFA